MDIIPRKKTCIAKNFFTKGHARTMKAKQHIFLSFLYRGIDVVLGLLLVRIVLNYIDAEKYGIWLVLSSVTTWFNIMNVGLDQGLRNKFAEALANNEKEKAKHYVSTCYVLIGIISLSFLIIFLFINPFLDWANLLNTSSVFNKELTTLAFFVFGFFSFTLVLKIITTIILADQKPSIDHLKNLFEKIFKFLSISVLIYTTKGSLLMLGGFFSLAPVVVLGAFSIYYYSRDYKEFKPSLYYVNISYFKGLMGIGFKFFVINVSVVVLFATDNIIISQLFGPEHVTSYEITKKYFGIALMLFLVVVQPFWSAVTDAYIKEDYSWIENSVSKLIKVWIVFAVLTIGMLFVSGHSYKLWVGDKVIISYQLSACWALFVILQMFNSIVTFFINGTGILTVQLIGSVFSIIFNVPLSIFFAKYLDFGISGVILGTNVSILIYGISRYIQYKKIIKKKAFGIWAR